MTAYGRVALAPADVVVPVFDPAPGLDEPAGAGVPDPQEHPGAHLEAVGRRVGQQVQALGAPAGRHRLVDVPAGADLLTALGGSPVRLSTMGRGLGEDPAAFLAAAAAGVHAATLARGA
jgi:hypothetical protein